MIGILERDGDHVLWRLEDQIDGSCRIRDGQADSVEIYDSVFTLTPSAKEKIIQDVKDWLVDTGEGEKWLEENP